MKSRPSIIALTIAGPNPSTKVVDGFVHLWAVYVRGFDHRRHCQKAFRGPLSSFVTTRNTPVSQRIEFDETVEYNSLYICGVARGPLSSRRTHNLHLALESAPGMMAVHTTYNGYLLLIENAVTLPIPKLPVGWRCLPRSFTQCNNFSFCVSRFGYPA